MLSLQHGSTPANLDRLLSERLFGVTRRTLAGDLKILASMGWLEIRRARYRRVPRPPSRPQTDNSSYSYPSLSAVSLNFLHPDLTAIANNLAREIGGVERFFLHVDYVVPRQALDRIDDWQTQLKQIWEMTPVPCVLLVYDSAKLERQVECAVYPVCIYYFQRATYLCAFGRNPQGEVGWYNYRLDRIEQLDRLGWTDPRLPQKLVLDYKNEALPAPEYIQEQMSAAWGFDFYLPVALMLLRFDRQHHRRYIRGTERHETFEPVSYREAARLLRQYARKSERDKSLAILEARSPEDAYYKAYYRQGDINVLMRVQAWRPFAEVLLPETLRQAIAAGVRQEWELYR